MLVPSINFTQHRAPVPSVNRPFTIDALKRDGVVLAKMQGL